MTHEYRNGIKDFTNQFKSLTGYLFTPMKTQLQRYFNNKGNDVVHHR